MLELSHVSYTFPREKQALCQISGSFPPGSITAILGPNGAGKTTLIRCILGICSGYTGQILLEGKEIRTLSPLERSKQMAYIPQQGGRDSQLSLWDFVLLGTIHTLPLAGTPGAKQQAAAEEAIRALALEELAGRKVCTLSGGERQLALIARAICQQSQILVMDEPDASLDPAHIRQIFKAVKDLASHGRTVLFSTHRPEEAAALSNQVLLLKAGQGIALGETKHLLTTEQLTSLYDTEIRVLEDGEQPVVRIIW